MNSQASQAMQDLIDCWKNSPFPSTKITSYFPAYVELFGHLRHQKCVFIETGTLGGGSLFMWRKWLGPEARIIGIDLNPAAQKWNAHGFEIFIGDQGDPDFWKETLRKIGPFDAFLDDGGHQSFQQIVTAFEAIRHSTQKSVVVIEDTHTSFMNDFAAHGRHSFLEYAKDATDVLTSRSAEMYPTRFPAVTNEEIRDQFENLFSIQFFNSLVAFKIDPDLCYQPENVWNHRAAAPSDFRYEGRSSAEIAWPNPFSKETVVVKGGRA